MYINQVFELSMVLDNDKFQKVLSRAYSKADYFERNEKEYIDQSLESKGIVVTYWDSQYRKKIKLVVNVGLMMDYDNPDPVKLARKLEKRIGDYFDHKYQMEDFMLSKMILSADINVQSHENVSAYLKVLQRIGRVKGYSLVDYDCFEDVVNFCLEGNSNHINFLLYDLMGLFDSRIRNGDIGQKKFKAMVSETEGILRAEVRLTKPKAVRVYAAADDVFDQIAELTEKSQAIFLDVFANIIPFGDYYKKGEAEELIRSGVKDYILRRKMLRLVTLIPEKKSLYLAQKAMNCRNIEKVMEAFAKINLSPVTVSKRHDVQHLKNLYSFLLEES